MSQPLKCLYENGLVKVSGREVMVNASWPDSSRGRDAGYPVPPAPIPACGTTAPGSSSGRRAGTRRAYRTRLSACARRPRRGVRLLLSSATFPLASSLPSPCSAGPLGRPVFDGFRGTLQRSDSLPPCTTVVPLRCTGRTWRSFARPEAGPPGFRTPCCCPCRGRRPRRVRRRLTLTASTMWPSACAERVGTQQSACRGSILCLYIPLSTLRADRDRYTRLTRGQCGGRDLHCLGLAPFTTVPACPGADPNAGAHLLPKAGAQRTLEAVRCSALILIEAPSPADHRGLLRAGKPCREHGGDLNEMLHDPAPI